MGKPSGVCPNGSSEWVLFRPGAHATARPRSYLAHQAEPPFGESFLRTRDCCKFPPTAPCTSSLRYATDQPNAMSAHDEAGGGGVAGPRKAAQNMACCTQCPDSPIRSLAPPQPGRLQRSYRTSPFGNCRPLRHGPNHLTIPINPAGRPMITRTPGWVELRTLPANAPHLPTRATPTSRALKGEHTSSPTKAQRRFRSLRRRCQRQSQYDRDRPHMLPSWITICQSSPQAVAERHQMRSDLGSKIGSRM